jgi:hypothetical protein
MYTLIEAAKGIMGTTLVQLSCEVLSPPAVGIQHLYSTKRHHSNHIIILAEPGQRSSSVFLVWFTWCLL